MIITKVTKWKQNFSAGEDLFFLGVPLLVSLIFKFILLTVLYNNPINNDGILYIQAAKQYALGNFANGISLYPMPVYPLLLTCVHVVIPDWIGAGYFISILSMILATIPLYYLVKIMFSRKVAFWACLIFALLPRMNEWSMYISRDSLFLLLFLSCIYFALRSIREANPFSFGMTFVLAWAATLVRIEGVIFLGFYFVLLFYLIVADKDRRPLYFLRYLVWITVPLSFGFIAFQFAGVQGILINRFGQVYDEIITISKGSFLTKPYEIYHFFSEIADSPPFSRTTYSFASLCRHFLPIIYFFGILQILVKILFPSSLISLYIGFKDSEKPAKNSGKFIFWIWVLFIGLGYYYLIKTDLLITRWGIVPATLLLPWVGLGMNRLWLKVKTSSHKRIVLFLIIIIILAPTIKTFSLISSKDITTAKTIKWLIKNDKINKVQIVSNNNKDSFYIDLEAQEIMDTDWKAYYYNKDVTPISIEQFAIEKNAEIIILKIKSRHIDKIDNFQFYQWIKSFTGKKYITFIYEKVNS